MTTLNADDHLPSIPAVPTNGVSSPTRLEALSASEAAALYHAENGRTHARGVIPPMRHVVSLPGDLTEIALADRFADRYADELRYVAAWGTWVHYDGIRWRRERTHLVVDYAKHLCREAATEADKPARALAIATSRMATAVLTLARADRRLAATDEQWDRDPWLLNTPDGTIDLRTGTLRAPDASDYVTKATAVRPDPDWPIPLWLRVVSRMFERDGRSDVALIAYMQRVLGYCLTGIIDEHAMWFLYGTGANGKSVLLSTIGGILACYHRIAPIETFAASVGDRHPTELAMLRGARLVTATETEEGRRWAEARIKALTGGDTIAARFMRQDFFEYKPQFKIVIAGNHRPGLRSVDEAIRRRFNLVPFATTIPSQERDPELGEKLRDEWPGILAWLIQGCTLWQERGLEPPEVVTEATTAYLASEDTLADWIAECCYTGPRHRGAPGALYDSWKTWAEKAGEKPGSQRQFGNALDSRGFTRGRSNGERFHVGLALRPKGSDG